MGERAVRAAAAAALVCTGLVGCAAATSGQAPGPLGSTRDAGGSASGASQGPPVTVYVIAGGGVVAIRAATGTPGRLIRAGTVPYATVWVEDRFGSRLLTAWRQGQSSLRVPL